MKLIDRDDVTARIFIDCFPNWKELHIDFQDNDYQGCKELVDFFRSLGFEHVESDGISVLISIKEEKRNVIPWESKEEHAEKLEKKLVNIHQFIVGRINNLEQLVGSESIDQRNEDEVMAFRKGIVCVLKELMMIIGEP